MVFVRHLTVRAWLWIWPQLAWRRLIGQGEAACCYAFEASAAGLVLARASGRLMGVRVQRFPVRPIDISDEQGIILRWRIAYHDLAEAQREILEDPVFLDATRGCRQSSRLPMYLAKALVPTGFSSEPDALWRVLLAIHAARWQAQREAPSARVLLYIERRPWFRAVARYALRFHVRVIEVPGSSVKGRWLGRHLPPELRSWLRQARLRWHLSRRHQSWSGRAGAAATSGARRPTVALESYGQLHLAEPQRYSDLFFWQQSTWAPGELLLCFGLPQDPLDAAALSQLRAHGIEAAVLHPGAVTTPE